MKAGRRTGGAVLGSSGSGQVRSRLLRRVAVAIALLTSWAAAVHASSTKMTVNEARDNFSGNEYILSSVQVADLNDTEERGEVLVRDGIDNWWEARYTDPYPAVIPAGSVLTSVVVTVQYKMEDVAWNGTLTLALRTSLGSIGTTTMPEYATATLETWDITGRVKDEPVPLAALNDLSIRMTNSDLGTYKVAWSYTKMDVEFEAPNAPPAQASITSPEAGETRVQLNPTVRTDTYSDPDGDSHASTDWEIYDSASPAPAGLVASSHDDATNLTSITIDAANVAFEEAGRTALDRATEYWVRARFKDDLEELGAWSEAVRFVTGDFPTDEAWPVFGTGCSSTARGRAGSEGAAVAALTSLAVFVCVSLLRRRASGA